MSPALIRDKEVANLIGMSPSWVRVQRHKRKTNQEHVFTLDPVFIGRAARYRATEVQAWLNNLNNEAPTSTTVITASALFEVDTDVPLSIDG